MRCSAPAQSVPGVVSVAVSVDGGISFSQASNSAAVEFRYLAQSFVTGLSPHSGPDTGGTVITVLGTGFSDGFRYTCSFHGREEAEEASSTGASETPAVVSSPSELTCVAPPVTSRDELGREAEVVVSVLLGDEAATPLPAALGDSMSTLFTYVPSLQLTVLNPDHGPAVGGTVVDVGGTNFLPPKTASSDDYTASGGPVTADTVWCRFGSTVAIGSRISDGLIRCTSPPRGYGVPEDVAVTISVNSGADFERSSSGTQLVRERRLLLLLITALRGIHEVLSVL